MATLKEKTERLRAKLLRWDDSYHNTGTSLVTDAEYDRVKDLLEKLSPNDRYFKRVGAPIVGGGKVKLPHLMPSLKKVRTGRGVEQWLERARRTITASVKLDGTSLQIKNVDGKLFAYTRGNGTVGRDVTHILAKLRGIGRLARGESVRGEVVLDSKVFATKYLDRTVGGKSYSDNRGLVNGTINATKSGAAVADMDFVAHGFMSPRLSWRKARVKLKGAGWNTATTVTLERPTPAELEALFAKLKAASDYNLDGLVLEDGDPDNTVSFKVDEEGIPVIVDHVEWNVTRYGVYKPIVKLRTPVRVGGVMVKQATGHNAAYIEERGIGPGAKILIIRSGDVIPKVVGTIKRVKPQLPKSFRWDGPEALPIELTETEETRILAKQLAESFRTLGIAGVRYQSAVKLVDAGIDSLAEAAACTVDDFEDAGLGESLSGKLVVALKQASRTVQHPQLMYASHCWPSGFGIDKFALILNAYTLKEIAAMGVNRTTAATLGEIKGLSKTTALVFLKGLPKYVRFVKGLGWRVKTLRKAAPIEGPLSGKQFVFTKVRDKIVEERITAAGGAVSNSVSKTTTAVVVRDKAESSGKRDKALALNVPLLTLDELKRKYKLTS